MYSKITKNWIKNSKFIIWIVKYDYNNTVSTEAQTHTYPNQEKSLWTVSNISEGTVSQQHPESQSQD